MINPRLIRYGLYGRRIQFWWPWRTGEVWKPQAFRGADEYCNPSVAVIVPFVGCFVAFWKPGPLRGETEGQCRDCRAAAAL